MIIFISIPWFLPAFNAGGPIQSIANLVHSYNINIEYKIFCSNKDLHNEKLNIEKTNEWVSYNSYTQVFYCSHIFAGKTLLNQIDLIKPQVIYINGLFSFNYNIIPLMYRNKCKTILAVRGMLHNGALGEKSLKKNIFLKIFKALHLQKQLTFHATDAQETKYIKAIFTEHIKVVEANNFAKHIVATTTMYKEANFLSMISIALISPMKNHLLVLQALEVCTQYINYTIYGPIKDDSYWQLCEQQIKILPKNIKVLYGGILKPNEVEKMLQVNQIFILPSKSENFGHAIIEALLSGKPVITSPNTPWVNLLENKAGINSKLDLETIASAIQFFATQQNDEYINFCKGALQYALDNNHISDTKKQYDFLFKGND